MNLKIGDNLPEGNLWEFKNGAPVEVDIMKSLKERKVIIFGLPGAFTPTCSASHLPGFLSLYNDLRVLVDEIWCISVNDAFVMNAWGTSNGVQGKIRMMADGSANYAKTLGLELDLSSRGMGIRMRRFSLFAVDSTIKFINLEGKGKFEVSDAETILNQIKDLH